MIGTDLSRRIGEGNRGDEEMMGRYVFKKKNEEEQLIANFVKRMEGTILSIYFTKEEPTVT